MRGELVPQGASADLEKLRRAEHVAPCLQQLGEVHPVAIANAKLHSPARPAAFSYVIAGQGTMILDEKEIEPAPSDHPR